VIRLSSVTVVWRLYEAVFGIRPEVETTMLSGFLTASDSKGCSSLLGRRRISHLTKQWLNSCQVLRGTNTKIRLFPRNAEFLPMRNLSTVSAMILQQRDSVYSN
jgi:hypothetical protein